MHYNPSDGDSEFWAIVDTMLATPAIDLPGSDDTVSHAQAIADAGARLWTLPLLS